MKINIPTHSYFPGNNFCVIEKYNLAFVALAKNGMSHLKRTAYYSRTGIWPEKGKIYQIMGTSPTGDYLFKVTNKGAIEKRYGKIKYFAVWRDPVERVISYYKRFILEGDRGINSPYFNYLGLHIDDSFDRFMEFVRFELSKSNSLFQDQHIRRQSDYYQLDDVDVIVPLNKLNSFLVAHDVPLIEKKSNATTVEFHIENKAYIEEIKELYKSDYAILKSSKLY